MERKKLKMPTKTTSSLMLVAVVLVTLFCTHQFAQDAVLVQAFAYPVPSERQERRSSALSASFSPSRTSNQVQNLPSQAAVIEDDANPPYLIERISQIPTNERLFHRISNMCIDVFFKELLLDEQQDDDIDSGRTRKRDKLL